MSKEYNALRIVFLHFLFPRKIKLHILYHSMKLQTYNYRTSMDTKSPITHTSDGYFCLFVIIGASSQFIITNPTYNIDSRLRPSSKFSHRSWPRIHKSRNASTLILFYIHRSPRTLCSSWTNGLVENQNWNLGTHLRLFLQDPPNKWSTQTQMYTNGHNTNSIANCKTLSLSNHSPCPSSNTLFI